MAVAAEQLVRGGIQEGLRRLFRRLLPLAPGRYMIIVTKREDGIDYSIMSAGKVEW